MAEEQTPTEKAEQPPATETAAKSGIPGKILFVVVIAGVSAASAGGVSWFVTSRALASLQPVAEAKAAETTTEEAPGPVDANDVAEQIENWAALPLDPFVVNLADADAARYLRIRISLMIDDKAELSHVEENKALQLKLRDVILQMLTQKTSRELIGEEGKNKLREEIRLKVSTFFKKPKVVDVMFTDFVIQL